MTTKQTIIAIKMSTDSRIPRAAVGYVHDLSPETSPTIIADRLTMLSRYVPDLVEEYRQAGE